MDEPTREFQGLWIPASLLDDENLTPFEKLLIAEIDSLSGPKHGPYHGSVEFLAKRLKSSVQHVQNTLSSLTKSEHLYQLGSDGRMIWRCVNPRYSANIEKYFSWRDDQKLSQDRLSRLLSTVVSPTVESRSDLLQKVDQTYAVEETENRIENRNENRDSSLSHLRSKKKNPGKLTLAEVLSGCPLELIFQSSPTFVEAWRRFIEYKLRSCGSKVTIRCFELELKTLSRYPDVPSAIQAMEHTERSCWKGVPEYRIPVPSNGQKSAPKNDQWKYLR